MKSLYFCGAGNSEGIRLAYNINRERERWDRMFVLDDDPSTHGKKLLDSEVIGGFEKLGEADPEACEVVDLVARTTAGRNAARQKIASYGVPFAPLISPNVDTFGAGVAHDAIVYHDATVGPESSGGNSSGVFRTTDTRHSDN
jgi:hypothetical protein